MELLWRGPLWTVLPAGAHEPVGRRFARPQLVPRRPALRGCLRCLAAGKSVRPRWNLSRGLLSVGVAWAGFA